MWEEKVKWEVSWSGTTIWENYYEDHKSFDNGRDAAEFCIEKKKKSDVDYINLKKSIVWRKKQKV